MLQQVAPIVHRFGRLDLEAHPVRQFVNLAEYLLKVLAAQQIRLLSAAHRNQEEHIPHHDRQLLKQSAEVIQIVCIVPADRRVHLDRQSHFIGPLNRLNRPRPRSRQSPECIVNLRRRPVQRNSQPHQPGILQLLHRFPR